MVVISAEFASLKPFLVSLHMSLTLVMWSSGGVVVESERLHLCGCHWSRLDSSFHFLPSGGILGNGYH